MKCPKCGSENCKFYTKTELNSSLFSLDKACCGTIFLGPLGILCGLCGSNLSTTTKEYWVCHDCGNKFKANGLLYDIKSWLEVPEDALEERQPEKKESKFIFEDEENYNRFKSEEIVEQFKRVIESGKYTELVPKIIFQNADTVQFKKLEKKYARYALNRDNILFIFGEENDIIVTLKGIYAGEEFYAYKNKGGIVDYKNCIYFNQICIKFALETEKEELLALLMELLPKEKFYQENKFKNLLSLLQSFPEQKYTNENHFSSQEEYGQYIQNLTKVKLAEFTSDSRNKKAYRKYKNLRKEKNRQENIMIKIGIVISIIIAIWQCKDGILNGVVVGIIAFIINIIIVAAIACSKKWNAYKYNLLPEKLLLLIEENECDSNMKTGRIKEEDYREDFSTVFKIIPQGDICRKCGAKLPEGAKWCPICGEQTRKED